eukprot:gene4857-9681_t
MSATARYSSNKTSNVCGNGVRDSKWLGRRSAEKSELLNDVVQWFLHSGVRGVDGILSRYADGFEDKRRWRNNVETGVTMKQFTTHGCGGEGGGAQEQKGTGTGIGVQINS